MDLCARGLTQGRNVRNGSEAADLTVTAAADPAAMPTILAAKSLPQRTPYQRRIARSKIRNRHCILFGPG
jgi:hypothetical protein